MAYQPIVGLPGQEPVAAEALVRWRHPVHGSLLPELFVPLAQRSRLIAELDQWVRGEASSELQRWQQAYGVPAVPVLAVNVCAQEILRRSFVPSLEQLLTSTQMEPGALQLEITEGAVLDDAPRAVAILRRVQRLGIGLAVDDFGTGYSSLNYLRTLPLDTVKIDGSFTRKVGSDPAARAIVSSVVSLAHSLDLTVVAEGVETPGQRARMVDLGADSAQGYLFGRPMPAGEFHEYLRKHSRPRARAAELLA